MKKQVNVSIRQFLCYTLQFWSLQMLIHLLVMTPIIPTFGLMYEPLALFHGGLLGVGVLLSSAIAYFSAGNRGWKEPLHGVAMVYIHAALYFVVAVGLQVLFIINNHLPFSGNVLGVTLLRSGALLIFVILTCVVFHFGAGKRRHRAKAGEQKETITFDVPPAPKAPAEDASPASEPEPVIDPEPAAEPAADPEPAAEEPAPAAARDDGRCIGCGALLKPGASFCTECGRAASRR